MTSRAPCADDVPLALGYDAPPGLRLQRPRHPRHPRDSPFAPVLSRSVLLLRSWTSLFEKRSRDMTDRP